MVGWQGFIRMRNAILLIMLNSNRMQPSDGFRLVPPDTSWPSAVLFETPEEIYQRVYRVLKPRSPAPPVEVQFEKFANADSFIRYDGGRLLVRITDLLTHAPSPVMESLAFLLVGKLLRKRIPAIHSHRYRLFLNRREMRQRAEAVRQQRGRKLCLEPKGAVHDLELLFERLNTVHFHGLMARPALGWSLRRSRTRLGHFDPSHNMIVISRIFDQPHIPSLALEYVMFHEMLHLRFPVEHAGARRCVHTPAFKEAEKEFPKLQEAKRILKKLDG
jgi:hypothetical protein